VSKRKDIHKQRVPSNLL